MTDREAYRSVRKGGSMRLTLQVPEGHYARLISDVERVDLERVLADIVGPVRLVEMQAGGRKWTRGQNGR